MSEQSRTMLSVQGLSKHYTVNSSLLGTPKVIKAVDDVYFTIREGQIFGLIGESGSGKTTLGQLVVRLLPADSGRISYNGIDITRLDQDRLRPFRKDIQIIFQHAQDTLDPKMTIGESLCEPLALHKVVEKARYDQEIAKLLAAVGLSNKEKDKYPFQLSGGQKQRVGIARAIACRPRFVVCDEPVSNLDVSVQAQILNLLLDLKEEYKLTYLFISHDLNVVQYLCDRVAVMYQGRLIEEDTTEKILTNPSNAYTRELVSTLQKRSAAEKSRPY